MDVVVGGRYGLLLTQGTLYNMGLQVANVSVVLPFVLAQQGIIWAAGLLYPAFMIGILVGDSGAPFVIARFRRVKHLVVAGTAIVMAALIALNATAARVDLLVAAVFLSTTIAIGVTTGISNVAYSEVISSMLPEARRGDLILTQGAIGAVVAIATTLIVVPFLTGRDPAHGHLDLLWLGAAGLVSAGVTAAFVGQSWSGSHPLPPKPFNEVCHDGLSAARSQPWFRKYIVTQLMFVPITLGMTFFSLHASAAHSDKVGSLHTLVVFTSAGMVVGALLWRIVYRLLGVRGMLVISALLGSTAAVVCIVADASGERSEMWVHGVALVLATVANQAVFAAAIGWISAFAADHERATLIGFGSVLAAVEAVLLGGVLGSLAHHTDEIWPVTILLGLNLLAVAAAAQAPTRPPDRAANGQDHRQPRD